MWRQIKTLLIRRAFNAACRRFDAAIADARARHGAVRAAQRAKSDAVHEALRRSVAR